MARPVSKPRDPPRAAEGYQTVRNSARFARPFVPLFDSSSKGQKSARLWEAAAAAGGLIEESSCLRQEQETWACVQPFSVNRHLSCRPAEREKTFIGGHRSGASRPYTTGRAGGVGGDLVAMALGALGRDLPESSVPLVSRFTPARGRGLVRLGCDVKLGPTVDLKHGGLVNS